MTHCVPENTHRYIDLSTCMISPILICIGVYAVYDEQYSLSSYLLFIYVCDYVLLYFALAATLNHVFQEGLLTYIEHTTVGDRIFFLSYLQWFMGTVR